MFPPNAAPAPGQPPAPQPGPMPPGGAPAPQNAFHAELMRRLLSLPPQALAALKAGISPQAMAILAKVLPEIVSVNAPTAPPPGAAPGGPPPMMPPQGAAPMPPPGGAGPMPPPGGAAPAPGAPPFPPRKPPGRLGQI